MSNTNSGKQDNVEDHGPTVLNRREGTVSRFEWSTPQVMDLLKAIKSDKKYAPHIIFFREDSHKVIIEMKWDIVTPDNTPDNYRSAEYLSRDKIDPHA